MTDKYDEFSIFATPGLQPADTSHVDEDDEDDEDAYASAQEEEDEQPAVLGEAIVGTSCIIEDVEAEPCQKVPGTKTHPSSSQPTDCTAPASDQPPLPAAPPPQAPTTQETEAAHAPSQVPQVMHEGRAQRVGNPGATAAAEGTDAGTDQQNTEGSRSNREAEVKQQGTTQGAGAQVTPEAGPAPAEAGGGGAGAGEAVAGVTLAEYQANASTDRLTEGDTQAVPPPSTEAAAAATTATSQPEPDQVTNQAPEAGQALDQETKVALEPEPEPEPELTPEQQAEALQQSEGLKAEGNALFAQQLFVEAAAKYVEAYEEAPPGAWAARNRAVYAANLAAAKIGEKKWGEAVDAAATAIEEDPAFMKAYMRRCVALQELDQLDQALGDARKVLEFDPTSAWAKGMISKLEPVVKERHEKLKDEMLGKLKELGNSVLGRFGMSLDNFKAVKDPSTGSYSISFQQ